MKIYKLSTLLFALIAGCTPEVAEWTPAQSPKVNKVDRAIFTYSINYSSNASSMDKREKRELFKFLKATVGSPLAVTIIIEECGGHSEKRIKDLQRELLKFGIPYDLITVETDYSEDSHKSRKHRRKESGPSIVLTIERYVVIPPSCGDFSQPIGDARQAHAPSNHGCAITANLGLMIANPRDLVKGRSLGDSDGTVMAAGVDRYRKDKTKALIDTSTNVSPGSTGTSGGASASTGSATTGATTGGSY
ncbi:MAG TPA: CpaD family pilus assembly lipoprotein [Alphaproteobacteria bacterium]|nr:CpaD family pilus assembly lipoprotein [Alphaproteobacteria bacterium]